MRWTIARGRLEMALLFGVRRQISAGQHTHGGWLLAKVLGLVTAQKTLCLDLWSSSTWELLVEAHNSLHADSILSSTEALYSGQSFVPG